MSGARAARAAFALVAVAVGGAAVAAGPIAAVLVAPVVLALAGRALDRRRLAPAHWQRDLVAAGAVAAPAGLVLARLGGSAWPGVVAAAAAAGALLLGVRQALGAARSERAAVAAAGVRAAGLPPAGAGAGPWTHLAIAADLGLEELWKLESSLARGGDLARVAADLAAAAARVEGELAAAPTRPPPAEPVLGARRVPLLGAVEHATFASDFEPRDPEIRDAYLGLAANRTAHAYLLRHRGGARRPTVVCVHGYGMGAPAVDALGWALRGASCRWMHRALGLDVALCVLPLHGARSIALRSGRGFLSGHPLWTSAAVAQAVWDLRRLIGWLAAGGGAAPFGVIGLSLGAYVTALAATLEPRIACAVPVLPPVDLAAIGRGVQAEARRAAAERAGVTGELLRRAWAVHSPLARPPLTPPAGRMIVAAGCDRVMRTQPCELWRHWQRPRMVWLPGGHLLPLGRSTLRAALGEHLRASLLGD